VARRRPLTLVERMVLDHFHAKGGRFERDAWGYIVAVLGGVSLRVEQGAANVLLRSRGLKADAAVIDRAFRRAASLLPEPRS
jgi:hypothetical protein